MTKTFSLTHQLAMMINSVKNIPVPVRQCQSRSCLFSLRSLQVKLADIKSLWWSQSWFQLRRVQVYIQLRHR